MKLLLTSQGILPVKETFLSLLSKKPADTKVAFITTAAYGESEERAPWLDICKSQLVECGIRNIMEMNIRRKTPWELKTRLADCDVIFVNGGNTFYLLYWARETGFDSLLQKLLQEGKLYVGVSAGSYLVCPTIEAAAWKPGDKNRMRLNDLTGLNLVHFLISAHFEEAYRMTVEHAARSTRYPIVALYDTQALLAVDGKYKVVGSGKKEFFNGFRETLA